MNRYNRVAFSIEGFGLVNVKKEKCMQLIDAKIARIDMEIKKCKQREKVLTRQKEDLCQIINKNNFQSEIAGADKLKKLEDLFEGKVKTITYKKKNGEERKMVITRVTKEGKNAFLEDAPYKTDKNGISFFILDAKDNYKIKKLLVSGVIKVF